MARETEEARNFALRDRTGTETSVFSGRTPRQAALKAARRLEPAASEQQAAHEGIALREKGTTKVHLYDGWDWKDDAPDDKPDWMPERITEANVDPNAEGGVWLGNRGMATESGHSILSPFI